MIKYIKRNYRYGPIIACDFCEEQIDEGMGTVFFVDHTGNNAIGDITELHFLHKRCSMPFEQQFKDQNVVLLSEELDVFLLYLVDNTKIDLDKTREFRKRIDELGTIE